MPEPVFEKELRVEYCYCDSANRMTLSCLLRQAQEISMQHCDELGLTSDFLASAGKVFLLAKLRVRANAMPKGGESVRIQTAPYLPVRLQYPRFTRLYSRKGDLLAQIDSRWMLVDTATKRIVRKPPEDFPLPFPQVDELEEMKFPKLPDEEFSSGEAVRVRYSMTDTNGHLNNAVYADLVCNQVERELMEGERICALTLYYHREALFGETVSLALNRKDNVVFVRGKLPASVCFEAILELEKQ